MRRRALAALLLILVATPVPALCAVCMPAFCPMEAAALPAMPEEGCHGMTHPTPAPDATLDAAIPDCCVTAAPAQGATPAVPSTTPEAPALATAQHATAVMPRTSSAAVPACESPPPDTSRPLYTLHSSLLI